MDRWSRALKKLPIIHQSKTKNTSKEEKKNIEEHLPGAALVLGRTGVAHGSLVGFVAEAPLLAGAQGSIDCCVWVPLLPHGSGAAAADAPHELAAGA